MDSEKDDSLDGVLTRYNETTESLEHRLSTRLAHYWTVRQQLLPTEGKVEMTVQELLDQIAFQPSQTSPIRTKDRLERALERLKGDNVIGVYSIGAQGDPQVAQRIAQHERGWWSHYAAQTLCIWPPQLAKA